MVCGLCPVVCSTPRGSVVPTHKPLLPYSAYATPVVVLNNFHSAPYKTHPSPALPAFTYLTARGGCGGTRTSIASFHLSILRVTHRRLLLDVCSSCVYLPFNTRCLTAYLTCIPCPCSRYVGLVVPYIYCAAWVWITYCPAPCGASPACAPCVWHAHPPAVRPTCCVYRL